MPSGFLRPEEAVHYCLSLPARGDRRFVFEALAPKVLKGVVEFVEALDGKIVPREKVERLRAQGGEGATASSWAVRFSKRRVFRKFLRSGAATLFFYEDDCLLQPDFVGDCSFLLNYMPKDWDIAFLGGQLAPVQSLPPPLLLRSAPTADNHCLMLSRSGARKILHALGRPDHGYSDQVIKKMIGRGELNAFWTGRYTASQRASISDNWRERRSDGHGALSFGVKAAPDDVYLMAAAVQPGDLVVEWGSGPTTALLARRAGAQGKVHAFEHDSATLFTTLSSLERHQLAQRVELHDVPPLPDRMADPGARTLPGQMKDYIAAPLACLAAGTVDVVLINGTQRLGCAQSAKRLLKPGGLLLFPDFWTTPRYRERIAELLEWSSLVCSTPSRTEEGKSSGTALFRRLA